MKQFRWIWSVVGILTLASYGFAKASPKATVQITTSKDKGTTKLVFKTVPNDGLVINHEGPWSLDIKNITGVKSNVSTLKRTDWKEDTATFDLPVVADAGAKEAEVQYKLVSFVCTKEKTQCYREVIENKTKIKL